MWQEDVDSNDGLLENDKSDVVWIYEDIYSDFKRTKGVYLDNNVVQR